MSTVTRGLRGLLLPGLLLLVGCEQTVVHGPVVDAELSMRELDSGILVAGSSVLSDSLADVEERDPATFETYSDLQKLTLAGVTLLSQLEVDDEKFYLVSASGGFDVDVNGTGILDSGPEQVNGTVHALLPGDLVAEGGNVFGALSDAAYQWVRPFIEYMTNSELRAALDEFAVALVPDVREPIGSHNYQDLMSFNPLFQSLVYPDLNNSLAPMKDALADGSTDDARRVLAAALVELQGPVGADEAMFRERISPDIAQVNCIQCHVSGGQAGNTDHVLLRDSNNNHLSNNLQVYVALVEKRGVTGVLNKPLNKVSHGGGLRFAEGSARAVDFETFLNLL